ncbi:MAG: gamma-glutamyl-gamma-aminobutyrate hydrolase family protein [Bacteroidetes bacterium]|nr:gamma-glutamyl-gamma-aminobutyrate hydrolase family protein [Bacteroidota bacterium]
MKNHRVRFMRTFTVIIIIIIAANYGCTPSKHKPMKIAVSKATSNYLNWLKKGDSTLIPVNMFDMPFDSAVRELERCSGLLLTGGEDVQPAIYGKESEIDICSETDPHRDTLELKLIMKALDLKMPILGICRGEQILNLALGGTLITDIPSYLSTARTTGYVSPEISHMSEDRYLLSHSVKIHKNTFLHEILGCDSGLVTSTHHQAVEKTAPGLIVSAIAPDGIPEAIEWKNLSDKPFLIGIQWHPERMDTANPLSGHVLKAFLVHAREYSVRQQAIGNRQ